MSIRKRTGLFLLSALGAILLLVIAWQFYKYHLVHKKIVQVLAEKTKGLYILHYDHLVFDEVAGTLQVRNIDIRPDTAVYQRMVREKKEPHLLLQIQVDALNITGVKTPKGLLAKELEGGKVEVTGARIRIMLQDFKNDSSIHNPTPELKRQLLGRFLKIAVDSVQVRDATIVIGSMDSSTSFFRGNSISLMLSHLFIDSSAREDSTAILFSRDLTISCKALELPSRNKKYTIGLDGVQFTSADNTLQLAQVRIKPRLGETAFAASFPMQKDRYDFLLKDIALRHIDRKALWYKAIRADSLVIGESAFRIYRDISRPPDTTSKVGKYPQQQLMHLPFPVSIGKILFTHSFIEYKEKNGKSHRSGKVQFYDVRAGIQHVTNRKADLQNDHRCIVEFHAKFLNKAPVNAQLVLLLTDPKGRFTIDGDFGRLDARSLNPLTEPMGLTRLERGRIDRLKFVIHGTDSAGDGQVILSYQDIKVSMLKKGKDSVGYNKKGIASVLANFVVKNSSKANPDTEEVHFQRILNKSIFNLIWKTLFSGIKKSVGMK